MTTLSDYDKGRIDGALAFWEIMAIDGALAFWEIMARYDRIPVPSVDLVLKLPPGTTKAYLDSIS